MKREATLQGKRIFLVFGDLELGGAERQGLLLAQRLRDQFGANVQIWGLSGRPGRLSELCDEKGIVWRGVKCGWGKYALTRMVKLAKFATTLRKERPDLILSYTRLPNLICGIVWQASGAKAMVWNQRDEGLLLKGGYWERLAARHTAHFICNSEMGSMFLQRLYGIPSEKLTVIRNGVTLVPPALARSQWRERLGIAQDVLVACMVANITAYKDHKTLLRAWARVEIPNQPPPVLVLAGRIDEGGEELKMLAQDLGIDGRVLMAGKVDDIPGLLKAVDLCVHSSRSEGLPNSVLEAMAAGLPVVGTDIPGIREAVGPVGVPYLAPKGDADALAFNVTRVLEDEDLRKSLGQQLQLRAQLDFCPSRMCCETAALLSSLGC